MKRSHATTPGRVTRRTYLYRRPKCKPLPIDLQVLPKRLTPTPLNPACTTNKKAYWLAVLYSRMPMADLDNFFGAGRWRVTTNDRTWYTDDWTKALGLRLALAYRGINASIYL